MSWMSAGTGLGAGLAIALPAGAIMGSLAAAIAWRLPRDQDWITGRSRCPHCGTALGFPDLVPVLSWLALRGRCRHCGNGISARYPVVETATALAFAAPVLANGGLWPDLLVLWLLAITLMVLTLVDLSHRYIPDGCLLIAAPAGLGLSLAGLSIPWTEAVMAGLLLGTGTWLVRYGVGRVVGQEALGLGDVKLFAVAGLWVGMEGIAPLLLGSALAGLAFRIVWRRQGHEAEMPFGPCIAWVLYMLASW
ncbi:prepilin peptidase [Niveispirillum sp. KHB5.9]|uniref:prepilin peptidase n=1 Tax=Niveispirillum sp. KHB5.9 TaxID=3400269 RepID=UPI003A8AA9B3